jgi:hypothetical protein
MFFSLFLPLLERFFHRVLPVERKQTTLSARGDQGFLTTLTALLVRCVSGEVDFQVLLHRFGVQDMRNMRIAHSRTARHGQHAS